MVEIPKSTSKSSKDQINLVEIPIRVSTGRKSIAHLSIARGSKM